MTPVDRRARRQLVDPRRMPALTIEHGVIEYDVAAPDRGLRTMALVNRRTLTAVAKSAATGYGQSSALKARNTFSVMREVSPP